MSKSKILKVIFFTPKYEGPQGSPLSQILIIIYVSDIPQPENAQTTTLSQFADDIALWSNGRNIIMSGCKIQKHLDKIRKWCNMWIIKLNPLKTKVLHFNKRKLHLLDCNIKMDNAQLKAEKTVKFLGVIFDHKLTFEEHIKGKINLCLNRNANNEVVRKCTNISPVSERIKQLPKSWYKKAIINNSDIKQYITKAGASLDRPLAYINKEIIKQNSVAI